VKRSNYELIVGGVIILSLFILITGVLWLKEVSVSRKMVLYTALFPNIGILQVGDPVTANGLKRGIVTKTYFHGPMVAVQFKLDRDVAFTDSSRITVQNIGLMGERQLGILLSSKGARCVPDTKGTVTYLQGYFDSGIAEAMGMLGGVLNDVLVLIDTVKQIVYQTVGNQEFVVFFKTVVTRLDTIVSIADRLVTDNKTELYATVDNLHTMTTDLKNLVAANRDNLNAIIENGTQLTTSALTIAGRIDSITATVNTIVSDLESGKGTVGVLLEDETMIKDLKASLGSLDSLVTDVNDNGLKLRVKLFGNKKYFNEAKER